MHQNVLAFTMVHSYLRITSYVCGLQYKKINGENVSSEIQVPLGPPIINNGLGELGDT